MDFQLNEDQQALVDAVQAILRDHTELPQSERLSYAWFDAKAQAKLTEGGFLDAGYDLGPLEAALVVVEAARIPPVVEAGASALIAPALSPDERLAGPVAVVAASDLGKAHRNLSIARTALIDLGEDAAVLAIDPAEVEAVESIYAYPYGRFRSAPDLGRARRIPGGGAELRRAWRIALAAEFAGAAQAAVDFTVDYVKLRKVFGHPVGTFQSVQHRLAQCWQIARAAHFIALRAAWSGLPEDADMAACYVQQNVQKVLFDLHQFNGAMGVTCEHTLHFWTYRLRALQAEAGGVYAAALDLAERMWGPDAPRRPLHGAHHEAAAHG